MIKLSAGVTKKAPIEGLSYSSRACSAGIEIEMSSGADAAAVRARLRQLHALVELAVDEQLAVPSRVPGSTSLDGHVHEGQQVSGNGNGARKATDAQLRAIRTIAEEFGLDDGQLADIVRVEFAEGSPCDLSVRQASSLIDTLKGDCASGP